MKRNPYFEALSTTYLFPEINLRKKKFLEKNLHKELLHLGIGDTTQPLPGAITSQISRRALDLSTQEGYCGYGPEQGLLSLREKIADTYYKGKIKKEEVFISDGAKCDIGRLQTLFGNEITAAVQDPAYPVYVDGSFLHGVKHVKYMPCSPKNDFFPTLLAADVIYFASPNNPTGAAATREQLRELVLFAKKNNSIIIFDAAYAAYIREEHLPRSIYEIEGACEVAIEVGSFSKLAGFSGLRLGWTIIPYELHYQCGKLIHDDWTRLVTTIFNGASILSQVGGLGVLDHLDEIQKNIEFYLENARFLKESLGRFGEVYGGENAPYLWVRMEHKNSWELFQDFLEKYGIVTTPGSGFGPSGEGFLRFSALGERKTILTAIQRLQH